MTISGTPSRLKRVERLNKTLIKCSALYGIMLECECECETELERANRVKARSYGRRSEKEKSEQRERNMEQLVDWPV